MELSPAVTGLVCTECAATVDEIDQRHRCPECAGPLAVDYDFDGVDLGRESLATATGQGIERYADLLPFPADTLVSISEGGTPLVPCPTLADELGVDTVYVKDESHNPTGSVTDRGLALAVAAAAGHGASDVALPTTGAAGRSMAAYAARAGLESHSFVPSRTPFDDKAMINVHGGDMSVVGGRYDDAADAFADAMADEDWYSVAPVDTPYRIEGQKTLAYELLAQLDWETPDAVVYPTGQGVGLAGLHRGLEDLTTLDLVDEMPALYAAQAEGCAPIVEAFDADRDDVDPVEVPDTICGGIEISNPPAGSLVLEALADSGGGAVASDDKEILEWAVSIAQTDGVEMSASSGVAASGARALALDDDLGADDVVVLVNTATASTDADVLRSHLMSKGV